MDKQTMQDIAELNNQVQALSHALNTQGDELAEIRAALEGKQDRVVLKVSGLSSEELTAIAEEARMRARFDSALAEEIATSRSS